MPENNEELETPKNNDWKMTLGKMVVGLVAGAVGTFAAEKVWDLAFSTDEDSDEDSNEE